MKTTFTQNLQVLQKLLNLLHNVGLTENLEKKCKFLIREINYVKIIADGIEADFKTNCSYYLYTAT